MPLNEKMLPMGKTRAERMGDYIYTFEVVGWNDRAKCNVWAEKSKRYSPAHGISGYQLAEAIRESDNWEYTRNLAKRINKRNED